MASGIARTLDLPDMGTVRDYLHLLTEDRRHLRTTTFRKVTGLSPSEMARTLGVHRPRVYQEDIPLEKAIKNRIVPLVQAADLAYELLGRNSGKAIVWIMAPNSAFGGDSPFEVIMRGDGNTVVDFLLERSGKKAARAF